MEFIIRNMTASDWPSVSRIYQEGIDTCLATFETQIPHWDMWHSNHLENPRLVIETETHEIAGWAALSPVSTRQVYAGVAEVSIYISENYRGKSAGPLLLKETNQSFGRCRYMDINRNHNGRKYSQYYLT